MFEFPAKKYHIFLIETWKREIIYTIYIYIRAQKVLKPIHKQITPTSNMITFRGGKGVRVCLEVLRGREKNTNKSYIFYGVFCFFTQYGVFL